MVGYNRKFVKEYDKDRVRKKVANANGIFDKLARKAESFADKKYRKGGSVIPGKALESILGIIEKINRVNIEFMFKKSRYNMAVRSKEKAIKRCWDAYYIILNTEVMYGGNSMTDEYMNDASYGKDGSIVFSNLEFFDEKTLEYIVGDEYYGNTAKGLTPIRNSGYDDDTNIWE